MSSFFRFPHTPHLAWLGKGKPRDDKVLSQAEVADFLAEPVVLEEKIDGANLGFSVGKDGMLRAQNRGQYLTRPFIGQFSRLNNWLAIHEEALFDALGESLILFGEWVAAVHSLEYPELPDYFLAFDVYDRNEQRFWSTARRDVLLGKLGLHCIDQIGSGQYQLSAIEQLLLTSASAYRHGPLEGIYLRQESKDWLIARAKLVQPDFVQSIDDHWRSRSLRWNTLRPGQPKVGHRCASDEVGG
ncbi:RNA ligase family protein [Azonexus sp.]|uniref:RNA ligase family protein n=1 Tax=Azonexus sp. TaxID=1872668 RepID=UPI0035B34B64